jgi:hypothetical protein
MISKVKSNFTYNIFKQKGILKMSHAYGQVKFKDDCILHFEYNGTDDFVINCLYKTKKEVYDNWRTYNTKKCNCGKDEEVEISTDYGNGTTWEGRACKYCMAFTEGFRYTYYEEGFYRSIRGNFLYDGISEWWQ